MPTVTNDFRVKIFYKASNGARDVILATNGWLSRAGKNYIPKLRDIIINWGRTTFPFQKTKCTAIFNSPETVYKAIHKDIAFNQWKSFDSPWVLPYTNSPIVASGWLNSGLKVIGRRVLAGSKGTGIIVYKTLEDFEATNVICPMYTQYIQPKAEYRIHVINNEIIDVAIKRRRTDRYENETYDPFVRNLDGGWVYVRSNIVCPQNVQLAATQAVNQLGLHFGAVDIIVEKNTEKPYVLEVNTAPGMSDGLAEKYANAFKTMVDTISRKTINYYKNR